MFTRAFLTLAIIAGLGSGGVAYYQWSVQIPALVHQRDVEKTQKNEAVTAHNRTKADLKNATATLNQSKQELAATKTECEKALARFNAQEKRAASLADSLAKASAVLADSQKVADAYQSSGLKPVEVVALKSDLARAQKEIVALVAQKDFFQQKSELAHERLVRLYESRGMSFPVSLPPELKGLVSVVDPKWDFVVLNVGSDSGVRKNGELLVSRSGRLVAKVLVCAVEKDHCIANIMPRWKFGELLEGDTATPAHRPFSNEELQLGLASYY